jgi:hypothetical protein
MESITGENYQADLDIDAIYAKAKNKQESSSPMHVDKV